MFALCGDVGLGGLSGLRYIDRSILFCTDHITKKIKIHFTYNNNKYTLGGLIAKERFLPDNLCMERKVRKSIHRVVIGVKILYKY
jgi:hypothetical protein